MQPPPPRPFNIIFTTARAFESRQMRDTAVLQQLGKTFTISWLKTSVSQLLKSQKDNWVHRRNSANLVNTPSTRDNRVNFRTPGKEVEGGRVELSGPWPVCNLGDARVRGRHTHTQISAALDTPLLSDNLWTEHSNIPMWSWGWCQPKSRSADLKP